MLSNSRPRYSIWWKCLALVCALAMLSNIPLAHSTKIPEPPTREEWIGRWQGYSDHEEFGLLELNEDGTGLFAMSYLPYVPVDLYQIKSWRPRGSKLDITLEPIDANVEAVAIPNVTFNYTTLSLTMRGKTWHRKMVLYNQKLYQARLKAAEDRMLIFRQSAK